MTMEPKRSLLAASRDYTKLVAAGVIVEINQDYHNSMLALLTHYTSKECKTIVILHESDKTVSDIVDKSLGARVSEFIDDHLMVLECCLREVKRKKIRALGGAVTHIETM